MTTVIIKKTSTGDYQGFTCKGHAGFAKFGKDIVCSAISILVINTINAMEMIAKEEMDVENDEQTGYIKCDFLRVPAHDSVVLMDAMVLGLDNICQEYGKKFIELKFEEV